MKDQNDKSTKDIFSKKEKRLKHPKDGFVRLHIDKITNKGTIKTTASIDMQSYIFLSYKLGAVPLTREANKTIKDWVMEKMQTDPVYDKYAQYDFSMWLKKIILWEIVDNDLIKKYYDDVYVYFWEE